MIYATMLVLLFSFLCVLAIDVGRVQVAKAELQTAADAAARYAARGVVSSSTPETTARQHALAAVADAKVDGASISTGDITTTIGRWNEVTRAFTATSSNPNAVQVTLTCQFGDGNGRPRLFARGLVGSTTTITASAVATAETGSMQYEPPAAGNLWLSAQPSGTVNRNFRDDAPHVWDQAGGDGNTKQSPLRIELSSLNVSAGSALSFEGVSGTATYVNSDTAYGADGKSSFIVALGQTYPPTVPTNHYNGLSNVRAPIGAIMAVFLSDDPPNSGSTPPSLDFNSPSQRDYATLSPQLKQVFFIGDGKRDNGEVQRIVVPEGATRVYMGMMDAWQWNDNLGNFKFNVYSQKTIKTVR